MLRPASDDDCIDLLGWHDHPKARAVPLSQHEDSEREHATSRATARLSAVSEMTMCVRRGVTFRVVKVIDREARSARWGDPRVMAADIFPMLKGNRSGSDVSRATPVSWRLL